MTSEIIQPEAPGYIWRSGAIGEVKRFRLAGTTETLYFVYGKLSAGTAVEVYNEAFRVGSATTTIILVRRVVGLDAEIGLSFDLVSMVGGGRLGFSCSSCEGLSVWG
jgi:hypothetical protein